MVNKNKTLIIKPTKTPILFSYENLVLIIFLGLAANFGVFFRIGFLEFLIILLLILVILLPVLVKLVKFSSITYVFTPESLIQESKWNAKWRKQISVLDIQQILYKQNFLQKMLDVGEIWITTTKQKSNGFLNIGNFKKTKLKIEKFTSTFLYQG